MDERAAQSRAVGAGASRQQQQVVETIVENNQKLDVTIK